MMMNKIFFQLTGAYLVLALMIAMVSAQYDYNNDHTAKPSSAVIVAADIFICLAVATVALVAGFIF